MSALLRSVAGVLLLTWACLKAAPGDRLVAEWAVRMRGSVILEGQWRPITDLGALPDNDF